MYKQDGYRFWKIALTTLILAVSVTAAHAGDELDEPNKWNRLSNQRSISRTPSDLLAKVGNSLKPGERLIYSLETRADGSVAGARASLGKVNTTVDTMIKQYAVTLAPIKLATSEKQASLVFTKFRNGEVTAGTCNLSASEIVARTKNAAAAAPERGNAFNEMNLDRTYK
jgi:hypothetical protein